MTTTILNMKMSYNRKKLVRISFVSAPKSTNKNILGPENKHIFIKLEHSTHIQIPKRSNKNEKTDDELKVKWFRNND